MMEYQGISSDFGSLARISGARSRSLSAENPGGEKGKGGMALPDPASHAAGLGQGWKVSPCVTIEAGAVYTLGDMDILAEVVQKLKFLNNSITF